MLLPKPTPKTKRNKRQEQAEFSKLIIGLDGRCMNPNHRIATDGLPAFLANLLSAHHIIYRSQSGLYTAGNGICFCAICHQFPEGKGNLKDDNGDRIIGIVFMISVLDYWEGKPEYRWEQVHEELRRKHA